MRELEGSTSFQGRTARNTPVRLPRFSYTVYDGFRVQEPPRGRPGRSSGLVPEPLILSSARENAGRQVLSSSRDVTWGSCCLAAPMHWFIEWERVRAMRFGARGFPSAGLRTQALSLAGLRPHGQRRREEGAASPGEGTQIPFAPPRATSSFIGPLLCRTYSRA